MLECRIVSGISLGRTEIEDMTNSRPDFRGNPLDFIGTLADVAGGLGNWIANGTPDPDSIPGKIQQRYRDHCDDWSNNPSWVQQFDPGARLFLSNACSPWLSSQGSGDPVSEVPFTGGQCAGNNYTVNFEETGEDSLQRTSFITNQRGPILEYWVGSGSSNPFASGTWSGIRSGQPPIFDTAFQFPDGTWLRPLFQAGQPNQDLAGRITSVVNVTNPADDCGDPDSEPGPNPNPRPDPGLDPEDEPFEREPGQPVLPMPEIPNPFGDPIQLPNFPLPRIDGPSLYPEDEPPLAEPGEPGTPEVVGGDEETEGEADEGEVLTGVLVEVSSAPGFARTVQNVSTPTYIGACYVYLGWEGQLDLQPEGQFLVDGQFFAAVPGMTHWRVRSAVGYTLTITPYYASKE